MIPESGTKAECKFVVLFNCTLLPCADEVYNIFTPFQLKRGLMPDHQWRVVRSGSEYVTVAHRYASTEHVTMRLVHNIRLEEWLEKLRLGEIRYIAHDP